VCVCVCVYAYIFILALCHDMVGATHQHLLIC
jgi:hypothetical protein